MGVCILTLGQAVGKKQTLFANQMSLACVTSVFLLQRGCHADSGCCLFAKQMPSCLPEMFAAQATKKVSVVGVVGES